MINAKHTNPPSRPDIVFPVLAESKDKRVGIVLFFRPTTGSVVVPGGLYEIGHYAVNWVNVSDKEEWRILDPGETVTLSNE